MQYPGTKAGEEGEKIMTVESGGVGRRWRVGGSSRPDASHQPKYEGPFFFWTFAKISYLVNRI